MDPFINNLADQFRNLFEEKEQRETGVAPAPAPAATPPPVEPSPVTPPPETQLQQQEQRKDEFFKSLPAATPAAATPPPEEPAKPAEPVVRSEVQTTVTEPGFKPSETLVRERENALKAQEKALRAQADAAKAAAAEEAAGRQKLAAAQAVERERVAQQQQEYKTNLATQMGAYESAYNELDKANKVTVNPRRFINEMSTGGQIMVGLGLLLSGFGGVDSVTKSMNILNKAVDDDIAAQRLAREGGIEAAKGRIGMIDKQVQSIKDGLKDDNAFNELQRSLRFGAIESQIESAMAKAKAPEVQAKLEQGLAMIQEKRAESQMKLEEMARDKSKVQTVVTKETPTPSKTLAASLTPAEKKADEEYGKKWTEWTAAGGKAGADLRLKKLEDLQARFEKTPFPPRVAGLLPEKGQKLLTPEVQSLKNEVQSVVQENLKPILGGQFAAIEATAVLERAFDPLMSKEENAHRLQYEINKIKGQVQSESAAAEYFNKNGTMKGFTPPEIKLDDKKTETSAGPAIGTVSKGYKYIGGDPSKESSWEKVK